MSVQAIIAAAGTGERLGGEVAKPFVCINGKPMVLYSLKVFEQTSLIENVIVATHPDLMATMSEIIDQAGFKKKFKVVAGGKTRGESIQNALKFLSDDTQLVLIHDGARPLINLQFVEDMIHAAVTEDALVAAIPVKPTIKSIDVSDQSIVETYDRSCLREIQTPQIFKKNILMDAYRQGDVNATDDAALVEHLGKTVRIFPGFEHNIKVTTPLDLFIAEQLLTFTPWA